MKIIGNKYGKMINIWNKYDTNNIKIYVNLYDKNTT